MKKEILRSSGPDGPDWYKTNHLKKGMEKNWQDFFYWGVESVLSILWEGRSTLKPPF